MSVAWVWAAYLTTGVILAAYIFRLSVRWRKASGHRD